MNHTTDHDRVWMLRAIELAHNCPPSPAAYCVGAVIVDQHGTEIATGYSRETDPHVHAEESALNKIPQDDKRLAQATLYTSLEPCSQRKSRPLTCTQLILATPIQRIVMAWREPSLFVTDCQGYELLTRHGRTVIEIADLADKAQAANAHLPLT